MFIPVSHNQVETIPSPNPRVLHRAHGTRKGTRVHRTGGDGAVLFRTMLLLICGMELLFSPTMLLETPVMAIAPVVAFGSLVAGRTFTLPVWMLLVADGGVICALILATGGAASPLLLLIPALMIRSSLLSEERDALVGAGIGIMLLLLVAVLDPVHKTNLLTKIVVVHTIVSIAAIWRSRRIRLMLSHLQEDGAQCARTDQERTELRRALEWQRQCLKALGVCDSFDTLRRCVIECAAQIVDALTSLDDATMPVSPTHHTLAVAGVGWLVIHRSPGELNRLQHDSLDYLVEIAAQRAAALQSITALHRHNRALTALWEGAGLLRVAPDLRTTLPDVCQRIVAALDLEWLALIGLDERQIPTPFLFARGNRHGLSPRLQPVHIRLAAEALRSGRALVRVEQKQTVVFLPVRLAGETSFVLAAHGAVDDAALQTLLLLFGNQVAERLAQVEV
ncbi:MAG: hypothetical protein ACUVSY_05250 [Roseiflexus sp.]